MQVELQLPLGLHETAEETFWRVYREMRIRTRRNLAVNGIAFRWKPYTNSIGVVRVRDGNLVVGLSEVLRDAPPEVIEALAEMLLSKMFRRRPAPEAHTVYRQWLNTHSTRNSLEDRRRGRGRKLLAPPQGKQYDLVEVFNTVNRQYFDGKIEQPVLGWGKRVSRTHLGHWDPAHKAIALSPFLDRPEVPRLVVLFVMYHEILHILHPVEHDGGRRRVHTRSFRAAEKQFEGYKEVRVLLKGLCAGELDF